MYYQCQTVTDSNYIHENFKFLYLYVVYIFCILKQLISMTSDIRKGKRTTVGKTLLSFFGIGAFFSD